MEQQKLYRKVLENIRIELKHKTLRTAFDQRLDSRTLLEQIRDMRRGRM